MIDPNKIIIVDNPYRKLTADQLESAKRFFDRLYPEKNKINTMTVFGKVNFDAIINHPKLKELSNNG